MVAQAAASSRRALRLPIRTAFQLQDDQIVGGPAWLTADASTSSRGRMPPTRPQLAPMLQTLLTDRSRFSHREQRELPVFALTLAKGRHARCRPSTDRVSEVAIDLARPQPCARVTNGPARGMFGQFLQFLAPHVNRVLVDRRIEWTLRHQSAWTPDWPAARQVSHGDPNGLSISRPFRHSARARIHEAPVEVPSSTASSGQVRTSLPTSDFSERATIQPC
jgi:hypothetical protein